MINLEHALTFGKSLWLWALLLVLPLGLLFYKAEQKRHELLALLVATRLRGALLQAVRPWKRVTRSLLLLLAWILLVIALAEPRAGYEEKKITTHGRDVILAIDTSRSMLATDVVPTRLARAQLLGQDVLDLLPGDRVGLIAFAGDAFLQAPMTLDHNAVTAALSELDTTLIPKGGTDIAAAIQTAEIAFGKGEGTSRALIIITDGEDLEVNAVAEAQKAAAQGIKIFTLGLGSVEGSLIPIKTEQGGNDFVRDQHGKPVLSKLDATRLKEIAEATGGFYQPFSPSAARTIVDSGIIPLEAGTTGDMMTRRPIEKYEIPLGMAMILLFFSVFLKDVRFSFPRFQKKNRVMLMVIGTLLSASLAHASTGITQYQQGNYQAALDAFEKRLHASGSPSEEVRFDAGTAAYKKGDYKKAIDYFTGAMTASSPKLQQAATYNLANALVRSGEATQESSEKLSDWKNAIQHYETVLKKDPKNKQAQENRDIVKKLIEDFKKQQEEQKKNPPEKKDQQKKDQQQKDQKASSSESNKQNDPSQKQPSPNDKNQEGSGNDAQKPSPSQPDASKNKESSSSGPQPESSPTPTPSPSPSSAGNSGNGNTSPTPSPTPDAKPSPSAGAGENNQEKSSQQQPPSPQENSPSGEKDKASPPSQRAPGNPTPAPTPGNKKNGGLKEAGADQEKAAAAARAEADALQNKDGMSPSQAEALLRSMEEEEQQVKFQQRHDSEEATKDW